MPSFTLPGAAPIMARRLNWSGPPKLRSHLQRAVVLIANYLIGIAIALAIITQLYQFSAMISYSMCCNLCLSLRILFSLPSP